MRRLIERTLSVVTLAILTSCGGEGRGGGTSWVAVTDTVGDTITVRTLSGGVWGDTAYLDSEVSIGMLEGPGLVTTVPVIQFSPLHVVVIA